MYVDKQCKNLESNSVSTKCFQVKNENLQLKSYFRQFIHLFRAEQTSAAHL